MEIKTLAGRGKGVRFDDDAEMYLMGRYLNASTGKVVNTEAGPPFEQVRTWPPLFLVSASTALTPVLVNYVTYVVVVVSISASLRSL